MNSTKPRSGRAASAPVLSPPHLAGRPGRQEKAPLKIPAILFEGDEPAPAMLKGPGQKYAVGPNPLVGRSAGEEGELPEAYGTQKLMLMARDPHWLYSHWDLTREQQHRYNALSTNHHLLVRVYEDGRSNGGALGPACPTVAAEVHVHPESRSWFIHVDQAGACYLAELGYYRADQKWVTVAISAPAITPSDRPSEDKSVQFAPADAQPPKVESPGTLERLFAPRYALRQTELFQEFGAVNSAQQFPLAIPQSEMGTPAEWTAPQDRAMDEEVRSYAAWLRQAGSIEISELLGRQLEREIPWSAELAGASSPLGGEEQRPKEFWLNVNAELIIYGGTEPDARVSFGGQPIILREDGTFSCRVALPDGEYEVMVEAVSKENDVRRAKLKVTRCTEMA